jgi:hypothetical protein
MKESGRKCTICSHPELPAIQKAIIDEVPLSTIAFQYQGLQKSSLSRHAKNHMGRPPRGNAATKTAHALPYKTAGAKSAKASRSAVDGRCGSCGQLVESEDKLSPEMILKRAERVLFFAESIVSKAQESEDSRLALQGIDRCQRALEGLMKASGLIGSAEVQVNVNQVNVLEKYPTEALWALQTMYQAFDAGNTLEAALEAVNTQRIGMKKAPALPRPSDDNEAA